MRHRYPLAVQEPGASAAPLAADRVLRTPWCWFGILGGISLPRWLVVSSAALTPADPPWIDGLAHRGPRRVRLRVVVHRPLRTLPDPGRARGGAHRTRHDGQIANGSIGMFEYGRRVVTERFGQVNLLFALDLLIRGVVRAFNRTLDWIAHLLPIPGLQSIVGIVNAIVRAATTYIDETIFSYNLARGDDNAWRSSKDALIYYAQNSKEILKTAIYVVVLDKVLTAVVWA